MMHPQSKADKCGGYQRQNHGGIAKGFSTRECFDDGGDETGRGNEDDVDFRVAKEPEDMLIKKRIAAFGYVEKVSVDVHETVHGQRAAGEHDCGHRKNN